MSHSGDGAESTIRNSSIQASSRGFSIDAGDVEISDTFIHLDPAANGGSGVYLGNDNAGVNPIHGVVSGTTITGGNPSNSNGIMAQADNNLAGSLGRHSRADGPGRGRVRQRRSDAGEPDVRADRTDHPHRTHRPGLPHRSHRTDRPGNR